MSVADRRALVAGAQAPSIREQGKLRLSRSGVDRQPRPANADDLALMRRIDERFTAWPFLGRRLTAMRPAPGHAINRKHVQRMRRMGIAARGPRGRRSRRRGKRSSRICCGI